MGIRTDRTRLSEAIANYLRWEEQRGLAATTRANDRTILQNFLRATGDLLVSSLETYHVEDWLFGPEGLASEHRDHKGRQKPPISPASVNAALVRVRRFSTYCQRRGLLRKDLVGELRKMPTPKMRPAQPKADVMLAMLDSATDPRDRALLAVATNTALRAATLKSLKVGDLDLRDGTLAVYVSKSRREHVISVTADLDQEMRRWLTAYGEAIGRPPRSSDFLLPARDSGHITWATLPDGRRERGRSAPGYVPSRPMSNLELVIQRAYSAVTGEPTKGIGVHTIRRGVARALYDQLVKEGGYDHALRVVSALLCHKNASTTEIYLGTSSEEEKLDQVMRGKPFLTGMVPAADNVVQLRAAR